MRLALFVYIGKISLLKNDAKNRKMTKYQFLKILYADNHHVYVVGK